MRKTYVLYRFYDHADVLLYVGLTADPGRRITQHRSTKSWWPQVSRVELEHFETMNEVRTAESIAIRDEAPLYNVHLSRRTLADNPDWPYINALGGAIFRGVVDAALGRPPGYEPRVDYLAPPAAEWLTRQYERAYRTARERLDGQADTG